MGLYADSLDEHLAAALTATPKLAEFTAVVLGRLRSGGYYEQPLVDAIVQTPRSVRRQYTFTEAFGFLRVYAALVAGRWRWARLHVGSTPGADRDVLENNARLARVSAGFAAEFTGGSGDHDGWFRWKDRLHLGGYVNHAGMLRPGREVTVGPAQLPLEVGYQAVAETMSMLHRGGVARWPYGSTDLWILGNPERLPRGISTSCVYRDGWSCTSEAP